MNYYIYETLIGKVFIYAKVDYIIGLYFCNHYNLKADLKETDVIKKASIQLEEYLNGSRKNFNLKLCYAGTIFQMLVWNSIKKITYGKTKSYKDVAHEVNNPRAARAVGMACNKNHIQIFIPCHRVIGSNKSLTGYAGGIHIKKKLLEIENRSAS